MRLPKSSSVGHMKFSRGYNMMKLSITLLAIVIVIIPVLGFAESNTSEVKSEPGVVLSSDSAKVTSPQAAPIKKNKKKKKQGKAKKVSFEESIALLRRNQLKIRRTPNRI